MSRALPVHDGVVALIEADAELDAILTGDKVFSGSLPQDQVVANPLRPLAYVVVGDVNERNDFGTFGADGFRVPLTLHIWAGGAMDNRLVLTIYAHLYRVLTTQAIPVVGGFGALELIGIFADPGGDRMHGVARFTGVSV